MSKFITSWDTTAQYDAVKDSLVTPQVALVKETNTVDYKPLQPTPPTPSHDYVEIAGVKWATMNVGATGVTDVGLYFQWGDTQGYTADQVGSGSGQKYFGWEDYKYCDGTWDNMTKYNSSDGKTVLDASDDAATAAWGGNWRMPTRAEFLALGDVVDIDYTEDYLDSGVAGIICTDKNDSSKVLFFPAAGWPSNGNIEEIYTSIYFSCSKDDSMYAHSVNINYNGDEDTYWDYGVYRSDGGLIRPVMDA